MSVPIPQSNFTAGEITHRLAGAITLDHYGLALTRARNFHLLPQGPMRKRSGYFYLTESKYQPGSGKETIGWIEFVFNKNQAYAIEAGDKYFRFYTADVNGIPGIVSSGGTPYEIATPYAWEHVQDLKYVQVGDFIYITHNAYPVHKLIRKGELNWVLIPVTYVDGPYLDQNKTDTTISWTQTFKPAGTGVPFEDWDLDDNTGFLWQDRHGNTAETIATYTLAGSDEVAINGYAISFKGNLEDGSFTKSQAQHPRAWTFEGQKLGSGSWITLDARSSEADWNPGQTRVYEFANIDEVKYHAFRVVVETNNGDKSTKMWEIALKVQHIHDTFVFSSIKGINNDLGFQPTDVGRNIRFQGPDAQWRRIVIDEVVNTTTVKGYFYGLWFRKVSNTTNWRLGAFSPTSGYPAACALFEERLALAGSGSQPRTVWLTTSADFEDFTPDTPLVDSSPITVTLTGDSLDQIKWLSPGKGLFAGTAGGVTSISGGNDPLTYKNVRQVSQTNYGASSARPIRVGPALLFQAVFSNCIRELIYNFSDDSYDAPDITYLNEHIYRRCKSSIWLESPDEIALTPMVSGIMAALTYVRAQKVYGSTAYETDGKFMIGCSVPNMVTKHSDNYVAVQRIINGVVKQYIEYAADPFEYQEMKDACFTDCSLEYHGVAKTTFTGLAHLEGKNVVVAGYSENEKSPKIYRKTVTGGQITVDSALIKMTVGLPYVSEIEILRSRATRSDQATAFGSRIRIDHVLIDLYRTAGLTINTPGFTKKDQIQLRGTQDKMDEGTPLHTGKKIIDIDGSWQDGGVVSIWSEEPLPAMIRVIMPTQDKEP